MGQLFFLLFSFDKVGQPAVRRIGHAIAVRSARPNLLQQMKMRNITVEVGEVSLSAYPQLLVVRCVSLPMLAMGSRFLPMLSIQLVSFKSPG